MAANTCTSTNGTVAGSDPTFTVTKSVQNREEGVFLYLKYTIGTSAGLTITVETINPTLSATDLYKIVQLSGNAMSALTYTIAAAGNYKIPIPLSQFDATIKITIVAGSAGKDAVIVANIMEA
jgi:hypothetical protein